MRPVRTRRRVLESLAKAKALVTVKVENRLQHHALCEAVLHQIDATFLALSGRLVMHMDLSPNKLAVLMT